jgi:hypothetical protein
LAQPAIFRELCELGHILRQQSEASSNVPEGVSQFQFPGQARSSAAYCVGGLVHFAPPFIPLAADFFARPSRPGDLRSA